MGADILGDTISPMCDYSMQLELWTGHRGMHPQGMEGTASTQAPYPTLRCCEGGMAGTDGMGCLVPVGHKDKGEKLEAHRVPLAHKDKREWLEQQALGVLLAQGVVGWYTQGGGKLGVQVSRELSWCMQGGLVEPIMVIGEEQLTTCACLVIQTTSAINPEFKVTTMCMEWSTNHTLVHSQLFMTTTFPVLCATLQQGWQSQ